MYNSYCLIFKVWIVLITIELTTSYWIFHFLINLMGTSRQARDLKLQEEKKRLTERSSRLTCYISFCLRRLRLGSSCDVSNKSIPSFYQRLLLHSAVSTKIDTFQWKFLGLCILGRLWKLNPTKMMVIVSWSGRWSMTTCQFTTGKAETKTCSCGSGSGASNCRCLVMFRDPTDPQMTDVVVMGQKTWKMLKFY